MPAALNATPRSAYSAPILLCPAPPTRQIPTLCTHPRLPTTPGTCRLCLVEAGGGLKPACATPAWDGLQVQTDTPRVRESIRGVLALLKVGWWGWDGGGRGARQR